MNTIARSKRKTKELKLSSKLKQLCAETKILYIGRTATGLQEHLRFYHDIYVEPTVDLETRKFLCRIVRIVPNTDKKHIGYISSGDLKFKTYDIALEWGLEKVFTKIIT